MEVATEKPAVVLVGVDESDHSYYALQWSLQRFFSSSSSTPKLNLKLTVVCAKPNPTSVTCLVGAGTGDVLPFVDSSLKEGATRVINKVNNLCAEKGVGVSIEVVEGDPRYVLCEAVDKHHADILVVGSHGYGKLKRMVLGSVSNYCAHHAHCTVIIVKKPKEKN